MDDYSIKDKLSLDVFDRKNVGSIKLSRGTMNGIKVIPPQKRISGPVWSICMEFSAYVGTVVRGLG